MHSMLNLDPTERFSLNPLAVPASPQTPTAMANSPADSNPIDRLTDLSDALLITIISFLPTPIAARTSVLCRRFRHLWEASPSLELISNDDHFDSSDENFVAMTNRALLNRNPSHPLQSLRLEVSHCDPCAKAMVSSLLAKARSLDLRHLAMEDFWLSDFLPILPIIFTINSLRCLSLHLRSHPRQELHFPSGINLTNLRSLSLKWNETHLADLNTLLSELCSLEDLHLDIRGTPGFSLSSQTIRKLKLIITDINKKLDIVGLSLPSLKSIHLEIKNSLGNMFHIHAKVPLLTKAVIKLGDIREKNVSTIDGLLNCISHAEELSLHLKESTDAHPIPILLESGKDAPHFHNLKHLHVTLSFHEHNLAAVIMMLHNCPNLKSLKLVHEIFLTGLARGKKRKVWQSKLPQNADGNDRYAYFNNLHLEENRKEVIKLLSKKCSS